MKNKLLNLINPISEKEQYKLNEANMWKEHDLIHKHFITGERDFTELLVKLGFKPINILECGFWDKEGVVLACNKDYNIIEGFRGDETCFTLEVVLSVEKLENQVTHYKLLLNWINPRGNGADEEYIREY